MNIDSKIWTYSNTGNKKHAFVNGTALCRKNVTRNTNAVERTATDYHTARDAYQLCTACDRKFNKAIEVQDAAEAEAIEVQDAAEAIEVQDAAEITIESRRRWVPAICCDHASMYHGARGCDTCDCTTRRVSIHVEGVASQVEQPTDPITQHFRCNT